MIIETIIIFIPVVLKLNIGTNAALITTKVKNKHQSATTKHDITSKCTLVPETVDNTSTTRETRKETNRIDINNRTNYNRVTPDG